MNVRNLVGRKIVKVHRERFWSRGERCYNVWRIDLDNGDIMQLRALETDDEPYVDVQLHRRRKAKTRGGNP